ncbi:hypothetical protein [Paraburkholderia sp. Cpub6]|uniref:hypothetical protein n=1 Tax=Paraburkholderia sp. Cpub6 TaxID=2723094 RepID=UPI00161628BE|nr:hypothetical protein [Paraburkholderia sp. Cpub6]MBB5462891.1 hypothetical protein [Paraburkholderia sp. Cpub6]
MTTQRPKGGELAKLAGMWSNEQPFRDWVESIQANPCHGAEGAAAFIRAVCGVDSRAQLDHDAAARAKFDHHIRKPYARYRASVGCV